MAYMDEIFKQIMGVMPPLQTSIRGPEYRHIFKPIHLRKKGPGRSKGQPRKNLAAGRKIKQACISQVITLRGKQKLINLK